MMDKVSRTGSQPTILTEEWLEATAKKARKKGWILLGELAFLFAHDPTYDELIPELWTKYQLDLRGPKFPVLDMPGKKIEVWMKLLNRWAFGMVGAVHRTKSEIYSPLDPIPYLNLSWYDSVNGQLIPVTDRTVVRDDYFVTLKELAEYLLKHVEIPLPRALFPETAWDEVEAGPLAQETPLPKPATVAQFVLKKAGSGWKLVWDGKETLLRQGGWKYIHFCMEHPSETFKDTDLDKKLSQIFEVDVHDEGILGYEELKDGFTAGDLRTLMSRIPKVDVHAIRSIKKRIDSLANEIEDARDEGQSDRAEKLLAEKEEIEEWLLECEHRGKLQTFSDEQNTISSRISKAIDRAIKELSGDAYTHFHDAFSPIYSSTKKYKPAKPISWVLS